MDVDVINLDEQQVDYILDELVATGDDISLTSKRTLASHQLVQQVLANKKELM